jgi:hypothetical protein
MAFSPIAAAAIRYRADVFDTRFSYQRLNVLYHGFLPDSLRRFGPERVMLKHRIS